MTLGVDPSKLDEQELFDELQSLYRTRYDTLRHGSAESLAHHDERMRDLEAEYRRRYPDREVDPQRLREGARAR